MRAVAACLLSLSLLTAEIVHARPDQLGVFPASATFAQLLDAYRRGDSAAAVAAFATWKPERLLAEAVVPKEADVKTIAAIAVFHTETAIRSGMFGRRQAGAPGQTDWDLILAGILPPPTGIDVPRKDSEPPKLDTFAENPSGWGFSKTYEAHSYLAYKLIDLLAKRAKRENDEGLRSFVKQWYILAISQCTQAGIRICVEDLIEKGEHDIDGDEDPEYLLLVGSLAEPIRGATGRYAGQTNLRRRPKVDWMDQGAVEARWALNKALKLKPSLVEARLRLGHTYYVTGEMKRAEKELLQAVEDGRAANHLFSTYLGAFFLGELYEDQGQLEDAIVYFRIAVDAYPNAHTSSVALGEALVRSERRNEGWGVAAAMFGNEGPGVPPILDPFKIYLAAQYWQGASVLRAMREAVR